MDIAEAQQKVLKLVRLAVSAPGSEEARTAASTACRLILEHGLLIMTPSDLVRVPFPIASAATSSPSPSEVASSSKKRRKRPSAKAVRETMSSAAETATTAFDAAGRVAHAVNGFRNAIRGGG